MRTRHGYAETGSFIAQGGFALTLALVLLTGPLMVGCATSQNGPSATQEASEQKAGTQEDADEATAAEATEDEEVEEEPLVFADECVDRRGDISVYALSELDGAQLCALLEQQEYVWSSRDQMWLKGDGSAAFVVVGASGSYLTNKQLAELGVALSEPEATYRLVTSGYSNPKRAFDGLAGKLMTCEDVEHTDLGSVGVVQGPSGVRALVVSSEGDGALVLTVVGEDAVAAGRLEEVAGRDLGDTLEAAFEGLTGRELQVDE